MLFISVMLAAAWVGMMIWLGVSFHDGDTTRAISAFILAVIIANAFTFLSRPKVTLDRNPFVERTIDFFIVLISNVLIAFLSIVLIAYIAEAS